MIRAKITTNKYCMIQKVNNCKLINLNSGSGHVQYVTATKRVNNKYYLTRKPNNAKLQNLPALIIYLIASLSNYWSHRKNGHASTKLYNNI